MTQSHFEMRIKTGCFHCDKREHVAEDCIVCGGNGEIDIARYQYIIDFALDELWLTKDSQEHPWLIPGIYRHSSGECYMRGPDGVVLSFTELNAMNPSPLWVDLLFPFYEFFCNAYLLSLRLFSFVTLRGV